MRIVELTDDEFVIVQDALRRLVEYGLTVAPTGLSQVMSLESVEKKFRSKHFFKTENEVAT